MPIQSKRNEYLRRAEDAQSEAEKARDPDIRQSWKRIADDYRALAETTFN